MKKMLFDFEKFDVYQKALEFANKIYDVTKSYPRSEEFGLKGQL